MKIEIRFCGGCNPRYDRGRFAQRFRAAAESLYPALNFGDGDSDGILIVGGCDSCCVAVCDEPKFSMIFRVRKESDFDGALRWVERLNGKE